MAKDSDRHFNEYTNLQRAKHEIIQRYLNAWFPILGSYSGKIVYIDTHAGAGAFDTGEDGSPLVALKAVLNHKYCMEQTLSRCEIKFVFFEKLPGHYLELQEKISNLKSNHQVPDKISIDVLQTDSFVALDEIITDLESKNRKLAPTFVFLDPFNYEIPGSLIKRLMSFERVELFINVMFRHIDLGLGHARKGKKVWKEKFDHLFEGVNWGEMITSNDIDERRKQVLDTYIELSGATWASPFRMLSTNGTLKYFLLHLTNHNLGREKIKEVFWKVDPGGDFSAKQESSPDQMSLFDLDSINTMKERNFDDIVIDDWLVKQLADGPKSWVELKKLLLSEDWIPSQLWKVIKRLKKENKINFNELPKGVRFSQKANITFFR